jgi:NAD(P)-dependent dehydrogenase (short-subunit alcohol dehydrogenase family)
VNCLTPGYTETQLTAGIRVNKVTDDKLLDRVPAGRWGGERDLEVAAVWLCEHASDLVSGTTILIDGEVNRRWH